MCLVRRGMSLWVVVGRMGWKGGKGRGACFEMGWSAGWLRWDLVGGNSKSPAVERIGGCSEV